MYLGYTSRIISLQAIGDGIPQLVSTVTSRTGTAVNVSVLFSCPSRLFLSLVL